MELIQLVTWNLSDIVKAVDGELINAPVDDIKISGVYHDSRNLEKGALFVPIIAERNGHDFIDSAIQNGAAASFWSDDLEDAPANLPLIKVEDTEEAFMAFGKWYLEQVKPRVVGITGSNGKTTTKDMTAAVLGTKYRTHKTDANENNQLGVPKTLLSMPEDTEVLVLEMGMSVPGEITILSKVGKPEVAVVTMIGESHIQAFGSQEKLTEEKMSILDGLKEDGLFIHQANEQLITDQLDDAIRDKTFGLEDTADIQALDINEEIDSTSFTVKRNDTESNETIDITIPVPGSYNVQNAMIATLIGLEFGLTLEEAKVGLEKLELTKNRLEWIDGKNDIRLLNDAYNASPSSMKAALGYFGNAKVDNEKIAVLGDILELGDQSKEMHESIAEAVKLEKFKAVLLYGEEMKNLFTILNDRDSDTHLEHFTGEKDALIEEIEKITEPGDAVLFKSSNGTDLLAVVDTLRADKEEN